MHLYAVRHTTVALPAGTCYGVSDVPLSASFEEEFEAVRKRVSEVPFDRTYSSSLSRCMKLAEYLGGNVTADKRLFELDFGKWEMSPWNEINDDYAKKWMDNYTELSTPDGESFMDMVARTSSFLEDISNVESSANILIITHGGVIRTLYHLLEGIELERTFNITIDFGSVHTFTL